MNERANRRKTRITVGAILSAAGLAMIAAGAGRIVAEEAKAEEIRIVEGRGEAGAFEMLEGASVRLNVEDGEYGIRFGARVSDREREYGFMVVPDELAERYNEEEREITLSEYCEEEAKKSGRKTGESGRLAGGRRREDIFIAGGRAVGESESRLYGDRVLYGRGKREEDRSVGSGEKRTKHKRSGGTRGSERKSE